MNLLIVDNTNPFIYDSKILEKNPSGASESYLNMLAVELAKKHKVFFIQRHRKSLELINNIRYLPEDYDIRQLENINNVLLQRNLLSLDSVRKVFPNANIFCWFHDFFGTKNFQNLDVKNYSSDIQFICLSNWHSKNIKQGFIEKGIKIKNKLNIIPHFIHSDKTNTFLKNKYNKDKVCFFSSRIKGIQTTYQLFKYLQKDKPNLKLYVGYHTYDKASFLFNDESVINLGGISRDEVLYHLSTSFCKLAINFTYPETFGCIFKEANLVGTPVLTTPLGALPEILSENQIVYPKKYSYDVRGETIFVDRFNDWYYNDNRPKVYLEEKYKKENVLKLWLKLMK